MTITALPRTLRRLVTLAALLTLLGGCSTYELRGLVVQGDGASQVSLVSSGDARLENFPVKGVLVELLRDPDAPWHSVVASATSDENGAFVLRVSEFGTGWMDERWMIRATARATQDASLTLQLPGSPGSQRVLVEMLGGSTAPGYEAEDLMEQYELYR
jgi:hypothetical protein